MSRFITPEFLFFADFILLKENRCLKRENEENMHSVACNLLFKTLMSSYLSHKASHLCQIDDEPSRYIFDKASKNFNQSKLYF